MTGYKEYELFAFTLTNDVMQIDVEFKFEQKDYKTIITVNNLVSAEGLVWKSMFYLMSSQFARQSQKSYEMLKEVIEDN
ncbi:MAG: hypothetical protein IIA45_11885 [Bacteroidetes bacterium]|nr:hypothetical protein [Bacteroidota bacterium]